MINFLYCLDENYNVQCATSIFSILSNTDEVLKFNLVHKNPDSFYEYKKLIDKKFPNRSEFEIFKFNKNGLRFPNVENSHVSEATYYRLYISEIINNPRDIYVYLDCDVICINNPVYKLSAEIKKLQESQNIISASLEDFSNFKHLNNISFKSEKYFNAGVMIINFQRWKEFNVPSQSMEIIEKYNKKLEFWDQDILNLIFQNKINNLNDGIVKNLDLSDKENNQLVKDVDLLHYIGKTKPWNINGLINTNSEIFQKYYRLLEQKYLFIIHKKKTLSAKYLLNYFLSKNFFVSTKKFKTIKALLISFIK